jgi:hypothetical protein
MSEDTTDDSDALTFCPHRHLCVALSILCFFIAVLD